MTRCCKKCGENKPLDYDYFYRTTAGRFFWTCIVCTLEAQKVARQLNPEHKRVIERQYYVRNREKRSKRKDYRTPEQHSEKRMTVRQQVLDVYGGRCVGILTDGSVCGISDPDVLAFDHINNDGAQHRKTIGSGSAIVYWLRANGYPDTFQILCHNCNIKKEVLRRRAKKTARILARAS